MTQTSQHSSSPSKASGTLKFMLQRFIESICLTNASCRYLLFQWIKISTRTRAIVIVDRSPLAVIIGLEDLRRPVILKQIAH